MASNTVASGEMVQVCGPLCARISLMTPGIIVVPFRNEPVGLGAMDRGVHFSRQEGSGRGRSSKGTSSNRIGRRIGESAERRAYVVPSEHLRLTENEAKSKPIFPFHACGASALIARAIG